MGLAQQGQREKSVRRPTLRRRRSVAIEWGTWRSGRSGGASGSVTLGKGRFFAEVSGARRRGGKSRPFGDQESISGNAHRGMMMEPSPASSFEMTEPDLLLELLIVALDAPAHHGDIDHALERGVLGQRGQPEFRGLLLALRPLDDQPLLGLLLGRALAGGAYSYAREARDEPRVGAVAPADRTPGPLRQALGELCSRNRLLVAPPGLAHQRPGPHPYRIGKLECREASAQRQVRAVSAIHFHHAARDAGRARPFDLLKCDFRLGLKLDLVGNAGLLAALVVARPALGKI